ncbi:hypothetical protein CEXT_807831 [Caerostris extrusa]|uniref:Uncharacterized protein n=1 Tax=Caerostris extrusa TaxID=172846 RepID=A0AAV4THZ3_CAEEX|nr:hypothetical protein CEXT_807831 [Caerostris extrusa]
MLKTNDQLNAESRPVNSNKSNLPILQSLLESITQRKFVGCDTKEFREKSHMTLENCLRKYSNLAAERKSTNPDNAQQNSDISKSSTAFTAASNTDNQDNFTIMDMECDSLD